MTEFSEKLLKKIGAWNEKDYELLRSRNLTVGANPHSTNAKSVLLQYYNNTKLQSLIFEKFDDDYTVFNFPRKYF